MRALTPPLAGLPEAFTGQPLAWTQGPLDRDQCVCCGLHQEIGRDVQAILCGRCSLILSNGAVRMEKPRLLTLAFTRHALSRSQKLRRNRIS